MIKHSIKRPFFCQNAFLFLLIKNVLSRKFHHSTINDLWKRACRIQSKHAVSGFVCIVLECPIETYGRNCRRRCSKHCYRSCDRKTGVCYGGCRDGWQPPMCNRGICCTILIVSNYFFKTNICSCLKWKRVLTFNQIISLSVIMYCVILTLLSIFVCINIHQHIWSAILSMKRLKWRGHCIILFSYW